MTDAPSAPDNGLDAPVFVFGCAWRCGSTLLQRLLCTVDGLIIWGENQGVSSLLLEAGKRLRARAEVSQKERQAFKNGNHETWIANMSPPVEGLDLLSAQWLRDLYVPATESGGFSRWGFKEVLHDAEVAAFLLRLFPAGRVIFLVRNPIDVLASMRSRSWYQRVGGGAEGVIRLWCHNVKSFLRSDVEYLLVRHEDLLSDPKEVIDRLETFLRLDAGSIDASPLTARLRGPEATMPTLGIREFKALARRSVVELGREVGYELTPQLRRLMWHAVRGGLRSRNV